MLPDSLLYYPAMRVSRFHIQAQQMIPLHAHPDQYGLMYLLEGKCLVRNYRIIKKFEENYILELISTDELIKDSHCIITPEDNVHSIIALEDSILLDIFSPGVQEGSLSEFLNITANLGKERFIAKVLNADEVKLPEIPILRGNSELEVHVE